MQTIHEYYEQRVPHSFIVMFYLCIIIIILVMDS